MSIIGSLYFMTRTWLPNYFLFSQTTPQGNLQPWFLQTRYYKWIDWEPTQPRWSLCIWVYSDTAQKNPQVLVSLGFQEMDSGARPRELWDRVHTSCQPKLNVEMLIQSTNPYPSFTQQASHRNSRETSPINCRRRWGWLRIIMSRRFDQGALPRCC